MTDDEFIAQLAAEDRQLLMELDDRSREVAIGILRRQREAVAQQRREDEARWWFDRWPDYLRWSHFAMGEAEARLARGESPEAIEAALFNGLPDEVATADIARVAQQLGPKGLGYGTRALINASYFGTRAKAAAQPAAERFAAERHRFGRSMARQLMAWAGVADDDIEDLK